MSQTTLNMEFRPERIWSELTLGAKAAVGVAAIAMIGASLAASIFLAGAALFSGLVMMIYGALAGRKQTAQDENPLHEEQFSSL